MVASPLSAPPAPTESSPRHPVAAADVGHAGVELAGVAKFYTSPGGAEIEALRGVDLAVGEGEVICLLGASGCGKSTLLRIVAGFERASRGRVRVRGKDVTGPGPDRAFVFQDYGLFPWLTVAENIAYGPRQRGLRPDEVRSVCERFTKMVGLARFADQYPHQLSGGMQQRVAIARVLANDPAVLLMDEPFGALDSLTRQTMQDELLRVSAALDPTIMLVTHSVEEAVYLADRVVVMTGGPNHGVPGHVERVVRVPLAHPRDVTAPDFNALKRELLAAIHGEEQADSRVE
jgi:ABC-type nitrate/sulfonate/bicarbonate transport system ATPase subunit